MGALLILFFLVGNQLILIISLTAKSVVKRFKRGFLGFYCEGGLLNVVLAVLMCEKGG